MQRKEEDKGRSLAKKGGSQGEEVWLRKEEDKENKFGKDLQEEEVWQRKTRIRSLAKK